MIIKCSIIIIINPRRACALRVTVVVLCVCLSVCLSTTILGLQATRRLMSDTSLVPRPSRGGREGLVRTVCACALISRHSGNSVLRTDNSVFKRHYRILSGLLLGSLREREHNQYIIYKRREAFAFAVQRPHYLSLEHRQVNTIASA